jgi:hypothetical protein
MKRLLCLVLVIIFLGTPGAAPAQSLSPAAQEGSSLLPPALVAAPCFRPSTPALLSPSDGATFWDDQAIALDWGNVTTAVAYGLQVDSDSTFTSPELTGTSTTSGFSIASDRLGPGTYYWRVYASSEPIPPGCSGPYSAVRHFTICPLLTAPTLFAPDDLAWVAEYWGLMLSWQAVPGATLYQVQIDDDPAFGSPLVDTTVTYCWYARVTPEGTEFSWRVRAANACGFGPWSAVRRFLICEGPAASSLISPAAGTTFASNQNITFNWTGTASNGYDLQIDDDPSFGSLALSRRAGGPPYLLPAGTLPAGTYNWRVVGLSAYCAGTPSAARTLTICDLPGQPTLLSPDDLAWVARFYGLQLSWQAVSGATSYQVQADDDAAFGSPAIDTSVTSLYYSGTVPAGSAFYWRIRARNTCGYGTWSTVRRFLVCEGPAAPSLTSPAAGASLTTNQEISFSWNGTASNGYDLEVDDDPSFGSPAVSRYVGGPPCTLTAGTLPRETYYWRVRGRSVYCPGPWSAVRSFSVTPPTATPTSTPTVTRTPTRTATCTPTRTPTPSPEDLILHGNVYGQSLQPGPASMGAGGPLQGARVAAILCQPGTYETFTGADGHYELRIPDVAADACQELTLEVSAQGYLTLRETHAISDLRSQPERDFAVQRGGYVWLPIALKP